MDKAEIDQLRETCHQIEDMAASHNRTADTGGIMMASAMTMHTDAVLRLLDTIDTLTAEVEALRQQAPRWVPTEGVCAPLIVLPMPFHEGYVLCAGKLPEFPPPEPQGVSNV